MKLLNAKSIKKIMYGVCLSDGHIDVNGNRFDFYSKHEQYALYIYNVLKQITHTYPLFRVKHDKRGYTGYRVFTRKSAYFKNLGDKIYNGRKELNTYTVSRLDAEALAHIWMCDGLLSRCKNRKTGRCQNVGWFCLEAFPKDELEIFKAHLQAKYDITTSIAKCPWGFGHRVRVGGINLQRFISLVYPYILDCFKYKTHLFYKGKDYVDYSLQSAEQYIVMYNEIEDIVRYLEESKRT